MGEHESTFGKEMIDKHRILLSKIHGSFEVPAQYITWKKYLF